MKKIKVSILVLTILICISNFCYADVVYAPTITENAVEIIVGYAELVGYFYIIIPLIVIYGILVKIIISKNRGKSKKIKIKKSLIILILIILLSAIIGYINKVIINNVETTIKYGYIDNKGTVLIEPKFEYAEEFYNGFAKIGIIKFGYAHHGGPIPYKELLGFINSKGKIIVQPIYDELSNFNNFGYAYGTKLDTNETFYKIDKNGNEEEITPSEYYKNYNIKQGPKDENVNLKKQVDRKIDIESILLNSVIPILIAALLVIIIIQKIFEKEEISDSTDIK